MPPFDDVWRAFIERLLYADTPLPWRDDPALGVIAAHAGLRDSMRGYVVLMLCQAMGLGRPN
jgi:hypothetical protein